MEEEAETARGTGGGQKDADSNSSGIERKRRGNAIRDHSNR